MTAVQPCDRALKILILKPSSLGDVVQAMPVLRRLKAHFPASQIYWWIASDLAPLLADDPDLAGLLLFERRRWQKPWHWHEMLRSIRTLRELRFDWVIDLQGLSRSAVFGWLANSGIVLGLDNPREGSREGAQLFYDQLAPRSRPNTAAPERYLGALSVLGVPVRWDFEWLPIRAKAAAKVRAETQFTSKRWVALVPGARWENKRWPAIYFTETVEQLAREYDELAFAIIGADSDRSLAATIARARPDRCLDLTGKTSLPEMIEWLRQADLVITNDTGPMHVAAALRRPLIAIFGPSDPLSTGPYGQMEFVLRASAIQCVPCLKPVCAHSQALACLHAVTPTQVVSLARRRLAEGQPVRLQGGGAI